VLVVLDTNVLLSALRAERSPPAAVIDAWIGGRLRLATSLAQIAEFKRAVRYPKLRPYLPRGAVGRLVNGLRSAQVLLKRLPGGIDSPDPDDAYLLAMAIVARADFLVTGDGALLSMRKIGVTRIVSPKSFSVVLARGPRDRMNKRGLYLALLDCDIGDRCGTTWHLRTSTDTYPLRLPAPRKRQAARSEVSRCLDPRPQRCRRHPIASAVPITRLDSVRK